MPRDEARNGRARSPEKIPNADRLAQLGQAVDRRTSGGRVPRVRSRRRKWIRRSVIAIGLAVVLIVGAVVGDYYYLGSLIHHKIVGGLQNSSGVTENILLIGSTTRCGLK